MSDGGPTFNDGIGSTVHHAAIADKSDRTAGLHCRQHAHARDVAQHSACNQVPMGGLSKDLA